MQWISVWVGSKISRDEDKNASMNSVKRRSWNMLDNVQALDIEMWFMNQQDQHHLEACKKYRNLGTTLYV